MGFYFSFLISDWLNTDGWDGCWLSRSNWTIPSPGNVPLYYFLHVHQPSFSPENNLPFFSWKKKKSHLFKSRSHWSATVVRREWLNEKNNWSEFLIHIRSAAWETVVINFKCLCWMLNSENSWRGYWWEERIVGLTSFSTALGVPQSGGESAVTVVLWLFWSHRGLRCVGRPLLAMVKRL